MKVEDGERERNVDALGWREGINVKENIKVTSIFLACNFWFN